MSFPTQACQCSNTTKNLCRPDIIHCGKAATTSHPIGPSLERVPTGGARGQGGVRDVSPPQRRRHRDSRRDERPPRLLMGGILVGHRDGDGGRQAVQDEAHADLRVGGVRHLFFCILLLIVCFVLLSSTRAYRRRHPRLSDGSVPSHVTSSCFLARRSDSISHPARLGTFRTQTQRLSDPAPTSSAKSGTRSNANSGATSRWWGSPSPSPVGLTATRARTSTGTSTSTSVRFSRASWDTSR